MEYMVISTIQLHRGMVHAKRHFEFNSTTQTAFFSHQSIDSDISVTWGKITRRAIDKKKKCFFCFVFLQSWYQSNLENLSVGFFFTKVMHIMFPEDKVHELQYSPFSKESELLDL